MALWLVPALLACTPEPNEPSHDESDADTDSDTDSDTDTDSDADTDTDIDRNWRWGEAVAVENADASFVGESPGDWAGSFVTNVGDTNGDGMDDIAIGAYGYESYAPGGGAVYLLYGRTGPWSVGETLAGAPSVVGTVDELRLEKTEPLGDVNGDGLADVGIMEGGLVPTDELLMFGSAQPWEPNTGKADVTAHVTFDIGDDDLYQEDPIGDFDGDGLDDWLLTFRRIDGATAWILSGAALAGTVAIPGDAVAAHLYGGSLATAKTPCDFEPIGDFTGDGFTDIAVEDPAKGYRIVPGTATPTDSSVIDATVATIVADDGDKVFVDPLGDIDGDGFGDLWSVSRGNPTSGFALFFGGPESTGELAPDRATVIAAGKAAFGLYDVGDLDGDGRHDLAGFVQGAVSKDGWDIGIVLGRGTWPAEITVEEVDAWIPGGEEPSELSPARAGDLDGDGMDDLLVATPTDWWGTLESAGTVRVFRGRETWPAEIDPDDYDLIFVGSHTNQGMGGRNSFVVGDVDGDGRDDVVSSSFYHPDDDATGETFVFLGQPAP